MLPFGLNGIKITLDGDRDTHNRMRPLRGGQGTFDRIVENIRQVAGRCRIAIGGNFDESSVDSYPGAARLPEGAGLRRQAGQGQLQADHPRPRRSSAEGHHPADSGRRAASKPLNGTCMTSVGSGAGSACDCCDSLDDKMSFLREETQAPRLPDPRRRAQRSVPRAHEARAHHRPGRLALRVPRFHRPAGDVDRPHRRPERRRGANRRARSSNGSTRGRNAATARSSRPVRGGCVAHRTHSLAT